MTKELPPSPSPWRHPIKWVRYWCWRGLLRLKIAQTRLNVRIIARRWGLCLTHIYTHPDEREAKRLINKARWQLNAMLQAKDLDHAARAIASTMYSSLQLVEMEIDLREKAKALNGQQNQSHQQPEH